MKTIRFSIIHIGTAEYRDVDSIDFKKQKVSFSPAIEIRREWMEDDKIHTDVNIISKCKLSEVKLIQSSDMEVGI